MSRAAGDANRNVAIDTTSHINAYAMNPNVWEALGYRIGTGGGKWRLALSWAGGRAFDFAFLGIGISGRRPSRQESPGRKRRAFAAFADCARR